MNVGTLGSIINLTICFAIPLMLVALGGMYSERSGVINLALEGIMIIGALAVHPLSSRLWTPLAGAKASSPLSWAWFWRSLIAGIAGMVFSLLLAFAAINLRADQTIGGTALNIFAPAFCVVVAWAVQGQGITDIADSHLDPLDARAATHHGRREPGFSRLPSLRNSSSPFPSP